jgi:signal transduction histidine kinase
MNLTWLRHSLRAKLLVAVVVCALIPLAGVGLWLSRSAVRSGRLMLEGQLDSAASRAASVVQQRWQIRKSDVLMLATSAPMRAALADPLADTAPAYARRAFATMRGISSVTAKDASNRVRWTLGEAGSDSPVDPRRTRGSGDDSFSILRVSVTGDAGRLLGEVEAHLRVDGLVPAAPTIEVAPSEFVAYRDRNTGARLAPPGMPAVAFDNQDFEWNDHTWLAVRHRLDEAPIDVVAAAQLEPFLAPFTRTAFAGAASLALSALVVIVLTIIVTGRLTRSLGQLALAADRVSRGALDTRVQAASDDEVGRVGRTFNGMLENIARMMRELSHREAVAAMGEIAATMAHQVRSPATAIRIDVQRAHDKLPTHAQERALLARALEQLDRMERAVSASLKVARAARSDFTELDVHEPLDRAIAAVRGDCAPRSLTVDTTRVPREPLLVRGDAASLEQLFGNVLTNAAQASADGRCVHVSAEAGTSRVSITIRDEGAGMTPDVLARAGEPLFSTKPEGTGLGLAIARRIAAAHGGELSIESVSGAGTIVSIHLRRSSPD